MLAKTWPLWESKTHPQKPAKSGKFHVRRSHSITPSDELATTLLPLGSLLAMALLGRVAHWLTLDSLCSSTTTEITTRSACSSPREARRSHRTTGQKR